ncbi:MAG TPA: helix-hairpin-helix domain-containing protein [Solirubrobacterales bacterium]|jgi:competence protein ComEA|nr:helix-hairpin-helix domain-containing protein [Solirubrobacterales bacterium]
MPELSRIQVAVYGAIAVALLFVGARAVRGEGGGDDGSSYTSSYSYGGSEDEGDEEADGGGEEGFDVTGGGSDVVVDVTGAVERPGVYRLPAGSRVDDAVKRAGGAAAKAELDSVNLAARLADGQQVVVPERTAATGAATGVAAGSEIEEEGPISLATATAAELDTIDGIGPVTAEDIIGFREEHGGLSSVDQLDQISGIGPATMEALRERLQP